MAKYLQRSHLKEEAFTLVHSLKRYSLSHQGGRMTDQTTATVRKQRTGRKWAKL